MMFRLVLVFALVLLCSLDGARARPAESSLRLACGDTAGTVIVAGRAVGLDDLGAAATATPVDVIRLALGDGGKLPARSLLPVLDRLLRTGIPVRADLPRTKARLKVARESLGVYRWTAEAPAVGAVCAGGELPATGAVVDLIPLLEIDLRAAATLAGEERPAVLRAFPPDLLDRPPPGDRGPSAAIALALGDGPLLGDLFLLFDVLEKLGYGRVLFLLDAGGEGPGAAAGLILSLTPAGDRVTPLPHRKNPPSLESAPAFRAIRLVAEEALLAMRLELERDGSMPEDSDFTAAESTALALLAFLGAGVRAGDGTPSGNAVLAMERWLLAWPPDPRRRYPRRERTIVSAAMIEALWRTGHPLLVGRAQEGLDELLKEVSTDQEFRDGIEKGFEAIGIARAAEVGLHGAADAREHLLRLVEGAVDPEGGPIKVNYSTRSSVDYIALANALALLEAPPADDPRILYMVAQTGSELPAIGSRLSNEKRAIGAFFHGRFALAAGGDHYEQFSLMLRASLPKAAPERDLDIEELDPDSVVSPWSGGGPIRSVASVALMTMAYEVPDQWALGERDRRR